MSQTTDSGGDLAPEIDRQILHEVGQVIRALEANGPCTEEELAVLVGAVYWERNRYRRALTFMKSDGLLAQDEAGRSASSAEALEQDQRTDRAGHQPQQQPRAHRPVLVDDQRCQDGDHPERGPDDQQPDLRVEPVGEHRGDHEPGGQVQDRRGGERREHPLLHVAQAHRLAVGRARCAGGHQVLAHGRAVPEGVRDTRDLRGRWVDRHLRRAPWRARALAD